MDSDEEPEKRDIVPVSLLRDDIAKTILITIAGAFTTKFVADAYDKFIIMRRAQKN